MKKLNKAQEETWDALNDPYYGSISNNESLLVHIARSQKNGMATRQLGNYFIELTQKVLKRRGFNKYVYADDMVQYSVMMLLNSYKNFDQTKSNNPYAYLVACCYSGCVQYINKERKQDNLKETIADRVLHAQEIK